MTIGLQEYSVTSQSGPPGKNGKPAPQRPKGPRGSGRGKAGWAEGLRKYYGQVVEEPLPDSFTELLRKLDQAGDE